LVMRSLTGRNYSPGLTTGAYPTSVGDQARLPGVLLVARPSGCRQNWPSTKRFRSPTKALPDPRTTSAEVASDTAHRVSSAMMSASSKAPSASRCRWIAPCTEAVARVRSAAISSGVRPEPAKSAGADSNTFSGVRVERSGESRGCSRWPGARKPVLRQYCWRRRQTVSVSVWAEPAHRTPRAGRVSVGQFDGGLAGGDCTRAGGAADQSRPHRSCVAVRRLMPRAARSWPTMALNG
jgi:hypothetical protein